MPADENRMRELVDAHQGALRVHCYRLLGSLQDAEDLTQETLLKAWRSLGDFEGRASIRSWLYRIATNACLDELDRRARRLLPTAAGPARLTFVPSAVMGETPWLEPMPDAWLELADAEPGPEARYEARESVELAFVAALQQLSGRQRAVLLLRDVLGYSAQDVAGMLDLSATATHSLLQRARVSVVRPVNAAARLTPEAERGLINRYMRAWEQSDVDELVTLLKDDARLSMPPLVEWYEGIDAIAAFFRWATDADGPGPYRFVPTRANGGPAFAIYARGQPFILQSVEADAAGIRQITSFMNPALFDFFVPSQRA